MDILCCPVMLSLFLHSLGNYTRRAIFPEMCKINQSSVDFHCELLWSLWLDWFIEFVPPDLFYGGGAKVTQHKGIIQYLFESLWKNMKIWWTVLVIFYFFSRNVGLGEDPYLSFLLVGLVELPGSLLTQAIADRLGRRLTMVICFVCGSVACACTVALPSHGPAVYPALLTLFLIAKLFITSAYTVQELIVYGETLRSVHPRTHSSSWPLNSSFHL